MPTDESYVLNYPQLLQNHCLRNRLYIDMYRVRVVFCNILFLLSTWNYFSFYPSQKCTNLCNYAHCLCQVSNTKI